MPEKSTNFENYHFENNNIVHSDNAIKNETKTAQTERLGYKFYYAKKATKRFLTPLSEDEIEVEKSKISAYKLMPEKKDLDIVEEKEKTEEVNKFKQRTVEFAKKRGVDIESRMIDNKNIYFLNNEIFEIVVPKSKCIDVTGFCSRNEIMINEELSKDKYSTLQHELIHAASLSRIYITNENDRMDDSEENLHKEISSGYHSEKSILHYFNEGLTEVTKHQIYFENGEGNSDLSYTPLVIFVTELAKDIAQKMSEKESKKVTQEDILTHFQIGMLNSDNKYLKIIIDNYGAEAFKALTTMGCDKEDVIDDIVRVADIFKLSEAKRKINSYYSKGTETVINIGDNSLVFA